jgi:hypothetical protein
MSELEKPKTRAANRKASILASERRALIRSFTDTALRPSRVKEAIKRDSDRTPRAALASLKAKIIDRDVRTELP